MLAKFLVCAILFDTAVGMVNYVPEPQRRVRHLAEQIGADVLVRFTAPTAPTTGVARLDAFGQPLDLIDEMSTWREAHDWAQLLPSGRIRFLTPPPKWAWYIHAKRRNCWVAMVRVQPDRVLPDGSTIHRLFDVRPWPIRRFRTTHWRP